MDLWTFHTHQVILRKLMALWNNFRRYRRVSIAEPTSYDTAVEKKRKIKNLLETKL
jgi:hypothetical protein